MSQSFKVWMIYICGLGGMELFGLARSLACNAQGYVDLQSTMQIFVEEPSLFC